MQRLSSGFVLGYHGCDTVIAEKLLSGDRFSASQNTYDWLGAGIYFWEGNPQRGLEFAVEAGKRKRKPSYEPTVIGAVLDLELCLDLTTKFSLDILKASYLSLAKKFEAAGRELPTNSEDGLRRPLDCAVVSMAHELLALDAISVDSVRGVFVEGLPLYEGAGFQSKTHVQIAIRNKDCIKGVFRVPQGYLSESII